MRASEIITEYHTNAESDPHEIAQEGDDLAREGALQWVNTPLAQRNIQVGYSYSKFWQGHRYFLFYNKRCFGLFELNEIKRSTSTYRKALQHAMTTLAPGISIATPHLSILPKFQGTGIGRLCYSTFLNGGNWVFSTFGHSAGASKLWDSLSRGNFISFYVGNNGKLSWNTIYHDHSLRLLGPQTRFKITPDTTIKGS